MHKEMQLVRDFHCKYDLSPRSKMMTETLHYPHDMMESVKALSEILENWIDKDPRYLRAHLILEEAFEMCEALLQGEELKALDGAADLAYVVLGTAVTFGWDLPGAVHEVHRSNMTKTRKDDDPGRCRYKGDSFEPPVLEPFLSDGT